MEDTQILDQDHEQQFQEVLNAIGEYKEGMCGTEKWGQVDAHLAEALNNFNFKFTLKQIKEILQRVGKRLSNYYVFEILDKCDDGILDQEAAEGLLEHCNGLNNYDFSDRFLSKVRKECQEGIKEIRKKKVQVVLDAIENVKNKIDAKEYNDAYSQLEDCIKNLGWILLSTEGSEQIVDAMVKAEIKFNKSLLKIFLDCCESHSLNKDLVKNIFNIMEDNITFNVFNGFIVLLTDFLHVCGKNSLDADCVKTFLKIIKKSFIFDGNLLFEFLNVCGENSLDGENLKNLYHISAKRIFKSYLKEEIYIELNSDTSAKLFQKLCEFHEIEKRKEKNKNLGILGSIGITFGGLFGLGAIGLGTAVEIGALTITIAAPIAAAVVGLVLMGIFGYLIDRFRVNKVLNEITEAKLNEKKVDEKEIPFDLRKRKEIQSALDNSKEPLFQNGEREKL